jgi:hypothetical protein
MVTRHLRWAFLVAPLFVTQVVAQDGTLSARVDRTSLSANESFLYVLRAEGAIGGEPDVSVIEQQFDILSRNKSTRIQAINGQIEQVAEWQYQLMPRGPGEFTIPSISLGSARSNEVDLDVRPALASDDSLADIFMEFEVSPEAAYVQSQIIYTLRLFVGVGTGRATLTPPQVAGGEAIVERLGEDRQYQAERGDRTFLVRERRYAIFPQETGRLDIGPTTYEAMVIPNRGFSRVQRFRSGVASVQVLPAVSPPPEYPNAVWLPASRLELFERWSDSPDQLSLGIPRTRTLAIEADGLLQTQLPELTLEQADGIRQYPDQPDLTADASEAGFTVQRVERYAVIAQREGPVELPGVEVPWWNVNDERWEVARIEPRTINVLPSSESFVDPVQPPAAQARPEESPEPSSALWPMLSVALAIGWMTTALLWWRSARAPVPATPAQSLRARRATRRQIMRVLKAACRRNDAPEAQQQLIRWAEWEFGDEAPNTLGAIADTLPGEAAAAVRDLEAVLYGRSDSDWNGARLAASLSAFAPPDVETGSRPEDALLPLYRPSRG